jgi:hypothetical protein
LCELVRGALQRRAEAKHGLEGADLRLSEIKGEAQARYAIICRTCFDAGNLLVSEDCFMLDMKCMGCSTSCAKQRLCGEERTCQFLLQIPRPDTPAFEDWRERIGRGLDLDRPDAVEGAWLDAVLNTKYRRLAPPAS